MLSHGMPSLSLSRRVPQEQFSRYQYAALHELIFEHVRRGLQFLDCANWTNPTLVRVEEVIGLVFGALSATSVQVRKMPASKIDFIMSPDLFANPNYRKLRMFRPVGSYP